MGCDLQHQDRVNFESGARAVGVLIIGFTWIETDDGRKPIVGRKLRVR